MARTTAIKGEKLYYTVRDIATMLSENESLIRFWNKEFSDALKPHRNKRGVRYFSKEEVDIYKKIYFLVKERGYTIAGAREQLKNSTIETDENFEVINTLKTIRSFLVELKDEI
jgi:DNA-binding transcriptional MerR regulator